MTDSLLIDCRVWTPAELAGVETLEVKGNLDVFGYAHPLPAGLTSVLGNLDVRGYAHPLPAWIVDGGADSRGYYFTGMRQSDGWRIKAGCRNYSIDEALAHWGPGGASNRPDCYALVKKIIAEIQQRKEM